MTGTLALSALLAASPGAGPRLEQLFPTEAEIFVNQSGLSQLELTPEVLAQCKPDLSDLRIFDGNGNEVPFAVNRGRPLETTRSSQIAGEGRILKAYQEKLRSEPRRVLLRETLEVAVPPSPAVHHHWNLLFESNREHFAQRLQVYSLDPEGQSSLLVSNASIFRLSQGRAEGLTVELPPFEATKVSLVLTSEDPDFLEPKIRFESVAESVHHRELVVPLSAVSTEHADGKTVIDLVKPRGIIASQLRITTSTGSFDRPVVVFDASAGTQQRQLAEGTVFRINTAAPVEGLEVSLAPSRGEKLRVQIGDRDSPPLKDLLFYAVVEQPSLVFDLTLSDRTGAAGILRFGGGRSHLPRYDLARVLEGQDDPGSRRFAPARLGPLRSNPNYDARPALGFAMQPGAPLDPRVYSHQRSLQIGKPRDGLTKLILSPEDLSILRADIADVRVIDSQQRQWPYLLQMNASTLWIPLLDSTAERQRQGTHYRLELPHTGLVADQLELQPHAQYLTRAFRVLAANSEGMQQVLAEGRLSRSAEDVPREPMLIPLIQVRANGLELIVNDGDDAPLSWDSIRVRIPLPAMHIAAPPGQYLLLLGDPEAAAPRYEIANLRETVLAIDSVSASTGPLIQNSLYQRRARLASGTGPQTVLLWVALGLAVLVLSAVTLRLVKQEKAT